MRDDFQQQGAFVIGKRRGKKERKESEGEVGRTDEKEKRLLRPNKVYI